jgi:hypothetical protein
MDSVATEARRLARLYLSDVGLLQFFMAGARCWAVIGDPLPEDATIIAVEYRPAPATLILTVRSSQFPPVPEGMDPPAIVPMLRWLDPIPGPGVN